MRLFEHLLGFGIEQGDLIQIEMRDHLFAQMEDMVALNTGDYATCTCLEVYNRLRTHWLGDLDD